MTPVQNHIFLLNFITTVQYPYDNIELFRFFFYGWKVQIVYEKIRKEIGQFYPTGRNMYFVYGGGETKKGTNESNSISYNIFLTTNNVVFNSSNVLFDLTNKSRTV